MAERDASPPSPTSSGSAGSGVVERPAQPAGGGERLDPGDHADDAISAHPCVNRVLLGDNLDPPGAPSPHESVHARLRRPAVQHGQGSSGGSPSRRPRQDGEGDRVGFGGRRYLYTGRRLDGIGYPDTHGRLPRRSSSRACARRAELLNQSADAFYFHIDYREAHYCKVLLDELFGRDCFLNEIVWAYDYGAPLEAAAGRRSTTRSLSTSRTPPRYHFDAEAVDREPYMAPGPGIAAEKAARGKLPTDVLVAHDRLADRQGEDRLPDAEAARRAAADRPGVVRRRATGASTSSPAAGTLGADGARAGAGRSVLLRRERRRGGPRHGSAAPPQPPSRALESSASRRDSPLPQSSARATLLTSQCTPGFATTS